MHNLLKICFFLFSSSAVIAFSSLGIDVAALYFLLHANVLLFYFSILWNLLSITYTSLKCINRILSGYVSRVFYLYFITCSVEKKYSVLQKRMQQIAGKNAANCRKDFSMFLHLSHKQKVFFRYGKKLFVEAILGRTLHKCSTYILCLIFHKWKASLLSEKIALLSYSVHSRLRVSLWYKLTKLFYDFILQKNTRWAQSLWHI